MNLLAQLIAAILILAGYNGGGTAHHHGRVYHHRPPCAVAFTPGCASVDPPPSGPFLGRPHI